MLQKDRTTTNAYRTLVDIQKGTNTMAGAMTEVQTNVLCKSVMTAKVLGRSHTLTHRGCLARTFRAWPVVPLGNMAR